MTRNRKLAFVGRGRHITLGAAAALEGQAIRIIAMREGEKS